MLLPDPGPPSSATICPRLHLEVDIAQRLVRLAVAQGDVVEPHAPPDDVHGVGRRSLLDRRLEIKHLEDAATGGERPGHELDSPADGKHREAKNPHVEDEGGEFTRSKPTGKDLSAAEVEDCGGCGAEDQGNDRFPRYLDMAGPSVVGSYRESPFVELDHLVVSSAKRLDQSDSGQVLLDDRVHLSRLR